jgi:lipoate synthase
MSDTMQRKPKWLRVKLPTGQNYKHVRKLVSDHKLHTICESGNCPNMGECWGEGTATFMILGNICTRSCGFCAVATGRPLPVDWEEPEKVAESVKLMEVKHCVITSVDRDELKDGGSIIWAETVKAVRRKSPGTTMETLIPDFKGDAEAIQRIIDVAPEIVSHNMETVRRLNRDVRIQARYDRSLEVLRLLKEVDWNGEFYLKLTKDVHLSPETTLPEGLTLPCGRTELMSGQVPYRRGKYSNVFYVPVDEHEPRVRRITTTTESHDMSLKEYISFEKNESEKS